MGRIVDRREFIKAIGATAAAATLAPVEFLTPVPVEAVTALHVGDVFTIAAQYAVNPVTGRETDQLQYFTITHVKESEVGIMPPLHGTTRIRRNRVQPLESNGKWM